MYGQKHSKTIAGYKNLNVNCLALLYRYVQSDVLKASY